MNHKKKMPISPQPANPVPLASAARALVDVKGCGENGTILLVEDEVALRGLTKVLLQRHGYRVLEAASGVEALSVWEKQGSEIDLLLTDMIMPDGLTGRDLATKLRAHRTSLKVIYVSGHSMAAEGTTIRLREASTFLQKPYHPQSLVKAVRESFDR